MGTADWAELHIQWVQGSSRVNNVPQNQFRLIGIYFPLLTSDNKVIVYVNATWD